MAEPRGFQPPGGWTQPGFLGRGTNHFAGDWKGLSSAAKDIRRWRDRERARDLANRWPWWSGLDGGSGDSGSDSGDSSSGGGYDISDGADGNPYSTDTGQGTDTPADAASQQHNDAAQSSAPSKEDAANSDSKETTAAKQCMDVALRAFQNGHYAQAQSECERAIRLVPGNTNLQQFRALCQFAQRKYQDAAVALYRVLADGPGWDWDTLSSIYGGAETYTKQLRALEHLVKEHPKDAADRFVLAYHYLVLDERDAASRQLQQVVKLQPKDKVSAGILQALERAKKGKAGAAPDKAALGR